MRLTERLDLYDVAVMDQEAYASMFGGTPMTRAKKNGLQRNALIAMHQQGDRRLGEAIARLWNEPDPTVRGTIEQIRKAECYQV